MVRCQDIGQILQPLLYICTLCIYMYVRADALWNNPTNVGNWCFLRGNEKKGSSICSLIVHVSEQYLYGAMCTKVGCAMHPNKEKGSIGSLTV